MEDSSPHTPLVSIIIPVRNGGRTLDACLRSLRRSTYKNREIIVVDDHSTDDTPAVAGRHGSRLIRVAEGEGANNARNIGAANAMGEILIFVDSDIMVRRETVVGLVEALEDGIADAVVGIYTARHRHETFVSQYKNLWVRYSYMKSPPAIDWLFGSISGIRRDAFQKLGGFNTSLLARHGHDDIELGKRFVQSNLSIALDMDIEVEHLKHYTLSSFIRNEFDRSVGFAQLATELGETGRSLTRGFVNVSSTFVLSTLFAVLLVLLGAGVAADILPSLWLLYAFGGYLLLNLRFLNYLEQVRGLFAMAAMIPFLVIDHLVCFAGSLVGIMRGMRRR